MVQYIFSVTGLASSFSYKLLKACMQHVAEPGGRLQYDRKDYLLHTSAYLLMQNCTYMYLDTAPMSFHKSLGLNAKGFHQYPSKAFPRGKIDHWHLAPIWLQASCKLCKQLAT
jgi:hypothetical protein